MNIEQKNHDAQIVQIFKVLSEPNRIRIIRVLYQRQQEMTCGQICTFLGLAKSTVSYHSKALREAGLTNTRQVGQTKYLSVNTATFNQYLPSFLDSL